MPRPGNPGRRHRRRIALAAVLGGAAAGVVLPDRLRIDHRFPIVDMIAWRPQASVLTLGSAGLLGIARATRPAAAAVGAVGLAGLVSVAGRLRRRAEPAPTGESVTILAANVLVGRGDTGALAALIVRERPDVVVLPEAGPDFRDKLVPMLGETGYRSWTSTAPGTSDGRGVTVLASARAGDVAVVADQAMRLRHLEVSGGILGGRRLFAVHTSAPVHRRFTAAWCRELDAIRGWTHGPVAPIVVGDLNATLDHSRLRAALGGCRSAADGTGRGLVATFPASTPRWFGIQIDHVLVPRASVTSRFEVHDLPGTDHRAVLTTVHLPPG
ncbi:endonuclease/exonuclease/phosphatase family protein [Pseudonocardia sp. KRD291]|uniref:endonuclease/exonuclease/phosphatase family protein n=1 Tax=Pseudonocardia sp. KRD291 TaxID=2792007 RepID=UPI001C49D160|nr:endonuclease/exonuclease/phosphatase family protein [Pseudonocardia sp. KRD291]MBW0104169.1 endonuclease/exonuclease/phosphatase family protein [Pseudonocardia sp. KRD291]